MSDKKYTRIEEEVMEILDRLEDERPASLKRPSHLRLVSSRPAKPKRRVAIPKFSLRALPLWWTLAASFGLAVLALLVRDTSQTLGMALIILAVLVFLSPFVFRRSTGGGSAPGLGGSVTKEWRGRDITPGPSSGPSAGDRARRWLDDRRGRPR